MKNAEGFKFMKAGKQTGQQIRGPNNNRFQTGQAPFINRDGARFNGQRAQEGQIWQEIPRQLDNYDHDKRKLQPWSGLGAEQDEPGKNR